MSFTAVTIAAISCKPTATHSPPYSRRTILKCVKKRTSELNYTPTKNGSAQGRKPKEFFLQQFFLFFFFF